MKRHEGNLRDLQNSVKCPNIRIKGVPEEVDKRKEHEKILEEIIVENFPKMGKEIATQVQETQSPRQDKPKAKHYKTHINQTNKGQHEDKILKAAREKSNKYTQGDPHKDNS